MGIQFEKLSVLAGRLEDRVQIDLVGLPLVQQPALGCAIAET